ncbi:IS701 family transposase [Streptomyces sp. NPDC003328]
MFDQAMARIAGCFSRVEPRATARAYLLGLLSKAERKNCWQMAEQAGLARPGPMQRLLRCARWDADAVRDDGRAYAAEHLGADGAVLIVDETGFVKKGRASAGVQRQYTGTAGRIENSQVGVFLAYATGRGRAMVDRRLYLPERSWCSDPERRQAAGIPDDVQFATKPRLAWEMIAAALDAGVKAPWVTGDEAYGQDPQLRAALEASEMGSVWPLPARRGCGSTRAALPSAPTPSPDGCPPPPGSGRAPAVARRARATTTGPGSTSALTNTATCSSAATAPPANSPSTCAGHPPWSHSRSWYASPVSAGASRIASRPPRPGRTRPLPGSQLDLVASAHHARHAHWPS